MVMCRCSGVGFVGNEKVSDTTHYAIALLDLASPQQFDQIARRICDLQREEHSIEIELQQLLADSKFTDYRKVFKSFGFRLRLEAIIRAPNLPARSLRGVLTASQR
jgi:hypothetical protein